VQELIHCEHDDSRPPLATDPEAPTSQQIEKALSSILASSSFRTTKQIQRLLQFLVTQALQGHADMLKERIVGIHVFEKDADYNTGDDPIVRVRAADLRRRLAQYYSAEGVEDLVKIDIYPGSYHPVFSFYSHRDSVNEAKKSAPSLPSPATFEAAPSRPLRSALSATIEQPLSLVNKHSIVLGIAFCLFTLLVGVLVHQMQKTAADMFWEPVLNSTEPVLIYFGTTAVYSLSSEFLDNYRQTHHVDEQGREFFVDFPPGTKIDPKDLVRANDRTMVNDFAGAASLIAFLSRRGKPFDVRWGHDISPGDLRHAPVILIGGFDNPLTLEVTRQLRFEFAGGDHIRDRNNPRLSWSIIRDAKGNCLDDYVIITRLVQPKFGSTLITAAGIGPEGTQAAAEFLNNPQEIANAVKGLPRDWYKKDMQIVLHIKTGYNAPNAVTIEAAFLR
jgi:hypothetical protein